MGTVGSGRRRLDVRVLGPVRLFANGLPVELPGPKVRGLLAVLVLNRGNPVTKRTLVESLWDDERAGSIGSLYGYVSHLRAALRGAGVDGVLHSVSGGYQLDIDADECDLGRFESAFAEGAQARKNEDFAGAARSFSAALAEWSGAALDDLHEFRFATGFAVRMGEEKRSAVAGRIEADIVGGNAAAVTGELIELTTESPLNEQLWRLLITALYVTGRQAEALDACLRLRRSLSHERGVDPDPQTAALEDAVRNQQPLPGDASGQGATKRDAPRVLLQAWLRNEDGLPIPIPPEGLTIGRGASNDVVIGDDNRVSRTHARILFRNEGVFVRDRDSANGVYVNDTLIRADTLLRNGDVIHLGSTAFGFEFGVGQPLRTANSG